MPRARHAGRERISLNGCLQLTICLLALLWGNACGGGGGGGSAPTPGPTPTPTYTVTFVSGSGGSLLGSATQTVAAGGSCSPVTAVPNTGYNFTTWTGTGFSTTATNPLVVSNVTQNLTITAGFTPLQFTVTFLAGVGGSLTGSTSQTVNYGASTSAVTALPSTGYSFTTWTGTGITTTATNPLVVSNVTQNLTITAGFTPLQFTVTFLAGAGGSLSGSTSQIVNYGASTSAVTALPNTGNAFTTWTGTGFTTVGTNPLVVSNVTQNLTITAGFTPQQFTVTFLAGAGGSLTGSTSQTVNYGASTSAVTAVPNTGYTFTTWTGTAFTTTATNPMVVSNVTQNLTITANFLIQQFTVTFLAGAGGSLTGTTTQTVSYGASTNGVTGTPSTGYSFTTWTGTGFTTTATNPLVVSNVTQNLTITANFSIQQFTVTFLAGAGGSLTGTTTQTVSYGASTNGVTATPNTGYTFTNWTGTGFTTTATNPLVVSNVTQNLTITAGFTPQQFTVTFLAGAGGSLTGSTSQTVNYGASTSTVTAVPNTGFSFTTWTGTGFTTTATNPLVVSNVTQNLTITANFSVQQFTVTFLAGAGGTLTGTTTQTVNYGTSASAVTATPSTGYSFTTWTGTGFTSTATNPLVVSNVTQNLTITAGFTPQQFTVTFLAGMAGSLTGATTQTVNYGASTSAVTAVPNTGYTFTTWTGTGFTTTATNSLVVSNVTQNLTITANFSIQQFTVTFLAGAGGSLTGTTTQTVNYGASTSAVTATPNSGYTFTTWTGTGFTTTATNPLVVSNVTQNLTITANFSIQQFTVTFLAGTGGSLTGSTSQTVNYGASTSAVTAVPNTGYTFTTWTGTGFTTTATNPLVVSNVTQNLTITANFSIQQFTVTFLAGTGGSLTGSTSQTVNYGASTSAVTAVPNTGYTFTTWTGTGFTTTATNPLVVSNVTQNLTITANFSIQQFTVTFLAGVGGNLTGSISQTVNYGASTSAVTAVPNTGYSFTTWTGTGFTTTATNPLVISNVTQNLTITAGFTPQQFTVTFLAGTGGSLTGTTTQTVNYGSSTSAVTAMPSTGYTFTSWTGAGFTTSATNPLVVSNVTQNLTLTAGFTPQQFTVTFVAGSGGGLGGFLSQTIAYGGSTTAVSATASGGYSFLQWTGTGGFASTSTNPLTVSNVTSDMVITANFTTLYVVTFVAGAQGSLSGTTSQAVAAGGSCTPVTSVPNAGYGFLNWTGTGGFVTSAVNPLTVTNVNANMTITANVAQLPVIGSFWATATTIGKGQQAILNWSGLSHFTSASIDNGGGVIVTPNGMVAPNPLVDTTYTLTATNAVGTATASISITVVPPPTIVSFTATPSTVAPGATTTLSWTVTGATGLSINNGVGVVAGISTVITPPWGGTTTTTVYTLTASNGYTTRSATTSVTTGPPVSLTYATNPAVYTRGVSISPNMPSNGGGAITSYTSTPALPLGLSLDPTTGIITGTPTFTAAANSYVIRGTNAYSFTTMALAITVNEVPPVVTYSSGAYALALGATVSLSPINTGGPVTTWGISPALPSGLSFNTSNGQITGTASTLASIQTYTVTATNSGGTSSPAFTLSVTQTAPHIAYPTGTYTFYVNQAITTLVPNNSGGAVTSWGIGPSLPTGLVFDAATGQISGTPTVAAAAQGYTVSATNAGGTGTTTPSIAVVVQPPMISVQPFGLILAPTAIPSFSVTASGTGTLSYQWYRNGVPIGGAILSTYTAPAFSVGEDGASFTVVVSDAFGGSTTSTPAVLSLFQDLATWLTAHPTVAGAIKWQTQAGDPANYYIAPSDAQKLTWANWSGSQQSDLNQAYLNYVAWFNAGAQQVAMVAGGTLSDLSDRPTNIYSQVANDSGSTMVDVSQSDMWRLYTGHVAFSLMLELSHQLPWSVTTYNTDSLRWLFDSSTMAWLLPNGEFGLGTYPGANQPTLRNNNRPRTEFTDPRWTYPWLKQAGIIGNSRLNTIGGFLDYMRQNLYHVNGGADTFGSDFAIWQYRGYSPVSKIVQGTIDSRYPGQGTQHYTEGCHGSTGFLNAALRVVNLPTQPIWMCGHELVYFISEDLYLDHADDPYNQVVRASSSPSLLLLIDSATWRSRFGTDETLNNWDYASPAAAYIGYAAAHFP